MKWRCVSPQSVTCWQAGDASTPLELVVLFVIVLGRVPCAPVCVEHVCVCGDLLQALQAACVVLAWHESKHPPQPPAPKQQRTPSLAPPAVPLAVSCCVAHLAAQLGADALSDHVSELDAEAINESMNFEKGKAGSVTPASVSSAQQMMNNLLTATRSPNW